MVESVYKFIELVGTSTESWEKAINETEKLMVEVINEAKQRADQVISDARNKVSKPIEEAEEADIVISQV